MVYRRNIIVVMAHGLRSDVLGDSETWPLSTPNFEKLAKRSVRLVATSACPADPGGMLSLITGLHPRQHGHLSQINHSIACAGFPAWLAAAGYHSVGVGLVRPFIQHLTDSVLVEDVNTIDSPACAYLNAARSKGHFKAIAQQRRQRLRTGPFNPDRLLLDPDDDIDCFIGGQARQRLAKMPHDKHWSLVVSLSGPGNDLPPPTLYDQMVKPSLLEEGFTVPDFKQLNALAELDFPRVMLQRMDPSSLARLRADYLGRVSLLDFLLGRLQQDLRQREDRERTWIVVCSDRGYLLGEHGLVGHRSFLAGAVETPVIIAPPTPAPHDASDGLVSTVDVAATIGELGGCDVPSAVAGRSLLCTLRGEPISTATAGACISEFDHRLMLETERFKIIFDTQHNAVLGLFDMLNDPDERENLTELAAGRNLLDALRWRLGEALLNLRAMPHGQPASVAVTSAR